MSNTHAHLRIVYLRALLNLFKGIIRTIDIGMGGDNMLEFLSVFITKASSIVHVLKLKFETGNDNENSEGEIPFQNTE